jgi:hypothetical protein
LIRRKIKNIIIDLPPNETEALLKACLQLGMINSSYHYVLTTFVSLKIKLFFQPSCQSEPQSLKDVETIDLNDFKYNRVSLSAFRLVDPDNFLTENTPVSFLNGLSNGTELSRAKELLKKVRNTKIKLCGLMCSSWLLSDRYRRKTHFYSILCLHYRLQ